MLNVVQVKSYEAGKKQGAAVPGGRRRLEGGRGTFSCPTPEPAPSPFSLQYSQVSIHFLTPKLCFFKGCHAATILMHSGKLTTLLLDSVGNTQKLFTPKQHWSLVRFLFTELSLFWL